MRKRNVIQQKIDALHLALKKVHEQEKMKVGELVIGLYRKDNFDIDKLKRGIAKILGDEVSSNGETKRQNKAAIEPEIRG